MPTQWESLANEHILGIAPYEPGKPIEELERELMIHNPIKLASNENPLPPSDRVQKAIVNALNSLDRYPDGSGFYLRQALAKKHGVMPDQVVLGNGSNELIELLVRTFLRPGDEAVVPHPSFVVYPMIVQAADAISAARPGARRDILESYVKRLEKLESIADSFQGVSKAFALQAGREIRIVVESDRVSDEETVWLSKDIARRIENELEYPGQIKVTVIRETRAVEYAR